MKTMIRESQVARRAPNTLLGVWVSALRVYQWPKNLVVFAALIFAQQFHIADQITRSVAAFFLFCAASSSMYLINDVLDVERDRLHPTKRHRALANGSVNISTALTISMLLMATSLIGAYLLSGRFFLAVLTYVASVMLYSLALKNAPIIDVLVLSMGFVIRAVAGALVLSVSFSNWLVVCTLFLALFLALGKRRSELELLDENATDHRAVLNHYTVAYLDTLILMMAGATLLTYTIYTCSLEVVQRLGTDKLYVTVPIVVYGLFRYLYLVHLRQGGGDPSRTLLQDKPLMAAVLTWGVVCILIVQSGVKV